MKDYSLKQVKVGQPIDDLKQLGVYESQEHSYDSIGSFKPQKRDTQAIMSTIRSMLLPELLPMRNERMKADEFSFYRGSVELMDHDFAHNPNSNISVVTCGDAHIGNFGFYASPERQLLFDLNDFDESKVNYWEYDLKRLLVSVLLAGKNNDFKPKKLNKFIKHLSKKYRQGLEYDFRKDALSRYYPKNSIERLAPYFKDKDDRVTISKIFKKAHKQNSEKVVHKYTETTFDGHLRFKDDAPRTVHIDSEDADNLKHCFLDYRNSVSPDIALLLSEYHITDLVRHSVGVGSFGTLCYLVLLTNLDGSHLVLQVKEALPTRINSGDRAEHLTTDLEQNEGKRIVDCQRILQSASDPFLGYFKTEDNSFYVRQFRDMKESVDLSRLSWEEFKAYTTACVLILANAHSQSPNGATVLGYVQDGKNFDEAMANWATSYLKQVDFDYADYLKYLEDKDNL